jgi:hypothetical protein
MLNSKVCFVATATLGDGNHPDIQILRRFRDTVLIPCRAGSFFVRTYYLFGPLLASVIERSMLLRRIAYRLLVAPSTRYARRKLKGRQD